MEIDDASEGESNHKRGSADENSNDKNSNNNIGSNSKVGIANSNEGQSKPKRQMKTPFQLETLEKAYALETYPTEKMRAELSEKLGLSDRQLQMWFCHRRLKDKKDLAADKKDLAPKKPLRKAVEPSSESPVEDLRLALAPEPCNDYGSGSGSGSGSSPFTRSESRSVMPWGVPSYYESQQAVLEHRAIDCVEAQLGEPLREDGPILGVEFDPLPPDAFGAPLAVTELQKRPSLAYDSKMYERYDVRTNKAKARTFHEYQFLPNQSGIRSDAFGQYTQSHLHDPVEGLARNPSFALGNEHPRIHASQGPRVRLSSQHDKQSITYPSPPRDDDVAPQRESYTNMANVGMSSHLIDHQIAGTENLHALPGEQISHNNLMRIEKKRKSDDTRIPREVEAQEMKIRKELEKQDNLRRKSEERMKKEMERQDRERRKEEERLMRERQREEERTKREQKREIERREKYLVKENLKAEKMRQKEEIRKEKEAERRKAALEKATARRLAKESLELIEDEQLELMELAASSKGFSSIIHLDVETLQNLESFKDSLCFFPPKSVKLKRPFAVQPWTNSEENVGNLLMVWRFFITFADVLELWPFSLDEFVQAFHDYDSRLLGEIHVALLKVIIKDIEDVARTPTGLGTNQNGTTNSGGGHPEIVEGAYAWGFDIRNWHKHLNQLTWPEIFRQLALSAGYGPQLKKSITWSYANDKDEGRNIEDIISTLRNGSAAENAVAKMQERGLLAPRRSRHRLTPGTVKFAAFHVLSLEGSKGLTVLELAEKIQKSGLRDLTTSKTPEASISVALTRDTKLFERIAPSTYRVRTAFRKDPADAESILSEARKKIQIFENGFLAGDDADDVEREEDSESDEVDEDPEVDDLVNPACTNKTSEQRYDFPSNGKENLGHNLELIQNEFDKDLPCFPENGSKNTDCPSAVAGQPAACEDLNAVNIDEDNMEIDERKSGDSWVQGLTEGEYSDLSVEERLNALVVLVGVANEGNSIRVVLEDRLEAANALKKQMWAEAQIDKVRSKDDYISKSDFPSINGIKVETQHTFPAIESNQSPLLDINVDNNNNEASPSTAENKKAPPVAQSLSIEKPWLVQDLCTSQDNPQTQLSAQYSKRSRSQLKSYISHIAEETYVYRSLPLGQDRRRNRYWQFVACASCNDPGAGRIFVEFLDANWRLIDSEEAFDVLLNSLDSRGIRESHLRLMLQKIESSFKENVQKNTRVKNGSIGETCIKNEADETDSSPDRHTGSDSPSSTLCGLNSDTSETSSSFKIELGKSESEKKAALKRYQDFQKWMWRECYNSSILCAMKYGKMRCKPQVDICDTCLNPYFFEDSHCKCCHQTFPSNNGFNFSKHAFQCGDKLSKDICILDTSLPLRTRLLKALLASIEAFVPPEALQSFWTEDTRRRWGFKLSKSSSVGELLQMLTLFERALQRDFLSSNFSTTGELLGSSSMSPSAAHTSSDPESVAVLPWVPQTTPAVSLRLFEFDASISYIEVEKPEPCEEKEARGYIKLPSRYSPFKSSRVVEPADMDDEFMRVKSAPMKIVRSGNKRRRGTHDKGRGKKLSKRMRDSKQDSGRRTVKVTENLSQRLKQHGRGSQGKGGGRGRRTVRKRRVEKRAVEDLLLGHRAATHGSNIGREPLRNLDEEWDDEKASPMMTPIHMGAADVSNSTEEGESDDNAQAMESDDNGQAVEYDQGNWEIGFNGTPNRWGRDMVGMSDEEDVEASEDDNENIIEENEEEDSEADVMSDGSDGMTNRVVNEEGSDSSDSEDSSD